MLIYRKEIKKLKITAGCYRLTAQISGNNWWGSLYFKLTEKTVCPCVFLSSVNFLYFPILLNHVTELISTKLDIKHLWMRR